MAQDLVIECFTFRFRAVLVRYENQVKTPRDLQYKALWVLTVLAVICQNVVFVSLIFVFGDCPLALLTS